MAESFMINFAFNGKSCFANVHAYDTTPREYHVHILNSFLFSGAPEHVVLEEKNGNLYLKNADAELDGMFEGIVGEIRRHEGR